MTLTLALAVMLAGGLGALLRYGVSLAQGPQPRFPWAVLVVNVVGSALGGVVLGLGEGLEPGIRLVLLTGFAGGLTTYSTFAVETVQLVLDGKAARAAASVAGNLVLGVGTAAVAFVLTR
ncbi:CrcB family protein [Salinibacterium sp. SYSU T00001]|uniref:fluoride efflux transporter FluC n=1 Tax=Homoserinimonas sedimenticola TaxID=2986805 RepID=UPI00223558DF|nr:CrcB family protein [Salinibacterium sedimenticola]MCW4385508.1 CrcB family protein [Salinibacterium sedimenticola]